MKKFSRISRPEQYIIQAEYLLNVVFEDNIQETVQETFTRISF